VIYEINSALCAGEVNVGSEIGDEADKCAESISEAGDGDACTQDGSQDSVEIGL